VLRRLNNNWYVVAVSCTAITTEYRCNLCTDEGTYIDGKMAFLSKNSSLRTNESFRNKTNDYYHKGPNVLEKLPINITDDVPLDNMHYTYIGVMKKLIEFLV